MIIADPIYNVIELPDELEKLIDTPVVQRLRRIKQLAFANLVYPSANHTRFEHSLGVAFLSGKIAEKINEDKLFYQICGLLHDVGHGPFSHASEDVFHVITNKTHEDLSEYWIKQIKDVISELGYDYKKVIKEIKGKGLGIVNSELDADRLDYLQRDAHHTGNYFGKISIWYLINNIAKRDGKIVFKEKAVPTIEQILIARGLMYNTVYLHKTTISATVLFYDALFNLIEKGYKIEEIMRLDDYRLIKLFIEEEIEEWKRIENRDLPKLLLEFYPSKELTFKEILEIREEIESKINVKIYIWPLELKEKRKKWKIHILLNDNIVSLSRVSKVTPYLSFLEKRAKAIRIYVDKKFKKEEIKESILKILDSYQ